MGMTSERLCIVGIDFRTAGVEVRERWAVDEDALARIHAGAGAAGAEELVVIRTCNRTELVAWGTGEGPGAEELILLWADAVGADVRHPHVPITALRGEEGARHLLRVASGLESQILGDIHILGQVRRSYRESRSRGAVGAHLHRLFDVALRTGKRVRAETSLMAGQSSVGSEAARHALEQIPSGSPRRIVIVGAGKVGSHAARSLAARPGVEVILLNRTPERARALAAEWNGAWGGLEELPGHLRRAGALVVATGAPAPWVDADLLSHRPADRALPVIDLSLPRNVEATVRSLPGVLLSDLDDVHPEAARVEEARLHAIPEVEAIIGTELLTFRRWLADAGAREALRPLREYVVEICRKEVGYVAGEDEAVERAANRIAAKLLSRPMTALRSASRETEPRPDGPASSNRGAPPPRELLAQALTHLFRDDPGGGDPLHPDRRPIDAPESRLSPTPEPR